MAPWALALLPFFLAAACDHSNALSILLLTSPRSRRRPLRLQLPLRIPVVLGRIHTMVRVIHKIKPRQHMQENPTVPALPARHTLHILRHTALPIQRLSPLNPVRHLAHVHLDLAPVLPPAVEPVLRARVEEQEACDPGNGAREPHDGCEAARADVRGRDSLGEEHEGGSAGGEGGPGEVVAAAGVGDDALEVGV